jgi:hypothetical protein
MAIGDKPNQNLFGTNYNAEEEERKKAELAAQGAMIGAEGVPASAFGQAPAVAPFSMEAAGQVNPMIQPQNLESFAQPQVTFRDYDVPATPPASALSVFTPGGEVKPNVDVNAITPSPETTTEAAPKNALLEMLERGDERQSMGLPRQAAPGIIDAPSSVVDPFTGKTIEKPTAFAADNSLPAGMTMNQAAIMNALPDQNQGMDMNQQAIANAQSQEAGQGQVPTAPTNGLTTVGGASLSEFLSGQAMPEQGFTQEESPLGGRGVTLTQDQMNELSAQRESRIGADQAISDRDRRAARGDGISMADQVDMAKANARGATPREVARGNQVANALGVDLKTGQPLQATGGLTFDQIMKLEEFDFKRGQEAYKREQDDLIAQGKKTEAFEQDSALLRQVSGDAGRIGRLTNEAIGITTEPGTTALSGSLLKHVAGSDANQLKSILAVISSKVALDRLMEVKKTGATLGQVSEKELAMLQNSFDALDQSLPPERLREALTNYANQLKKVEDQTQRAFIDKHGQEKFNKIMGGGSTGQGEPRYVNDQDVGDSVDTYYNPSK